MRDDGCAGEPPFGTPAEDRAIAPVEPVLVIDEHELFGTALRMALHTMGVDAHRLPLSDHATMISSAAGYRRGVVLLDPASLAPGAEDTATSVAGLVAALVRQGKRVLVLGRGGADAVEDAVVARALAAGAIGVVDQTIGFEQLVRLLARVAAGRPPHGDGRANCRPAARPDRRRERARHIAARLARLGPGEAEVLEMMAEGNRAAAIAEATAAPSATVRDQIRAILSALEVPTQLHAVALLYELRHTAADRASLTG